MSEISNYIDFIRDRGRSLSEINPGSNELALSVDDALKAVELLRGTQSIIFGGDILSNESDVLIYAYQQWGSEYHYLNWSCEKMDNENQSEYCDRSYDVAREGIIKAKEVADRFGKICFIVLVV